ncbi:unnamed protein product [Didymodactylos carnosus]|uniref:SLC41A/MgtE integral membrane domain-containing protein n=1 Tax=Didymodactylos carnosus TaxID=1234261 RepID=A0A815DG05_9BILA|nr:unnamed protein product [Didymodactylos carnosus]CAF1295826.1 unnamed protein product [Didymodactylos carnosus]CAF3634485.1 unnamed protein product [Didymodactylos carnosus]CAF4110273.1 unnamed protein product [Didymodactylos carnosus]
MDNETSMRRRNVQKDDQVCEPQSVTLSKAIDQFEHYLSQLSSKDLKQYEHHIRSKLDRDESKEHSLPTSTSFVKSNFDRFILLGILLIFQSFSSFILGSFSDLISKHIQITMYLTMLVGSGGNAGNQAAVLMIRQLSVGTRYKLAKLLFNETLAALFIGTLITLVGFIRVLIEEKGELRISLTISLALFSIVTISIVLGTCLPLIFNRIFGLDPAHAGPTIQVCMDIIGVCITCAVGQWMLN